MYNYLCMNKKFNIKKIFICLLGFTIVITTSFFCISKAQEKEKLLHFVQISDTHLQHSHAKNAERLLGSSEKLIKAEIEQINNIDDLDFVLGTGDLVDVPEEALVDKFVEIAMSIKHPFYAVFGNHDVGVNSKVNKKKYIEKFRGYEDAMSFTDSMPYYSFSPNEKFTVICLDGTTEKIVTAHGQIDDEQLNWLKDELEKNKDKFIIIALHFPPIEPYKSDSHFIIEPDRTKLLDLINSYKNVIGVFTGHYHAARLFKIKNKIYNSCPATVQYPNAFREITIYKDGPKHILVDFKWHEINEPKLREISKNSSRTWKLTEGTSEDKEQKIKLKIY